VRCWECVFDDVKKSQAWAGCGKLDKNVIVVREVAQVAADGGDPPRKGGIDNHPRIQRRSMKTGIGRRRPFSDHHLRLKPHLLANHLSDRASPCRRMAWRQTSKPELSWRSFALNTTRRSRGGRG
jgi:hypothetical protein